ncbi:putative fatty acyl-CoA reductase CG5065 [Maniola jurtina]|uniref:putative fatty acyl-CoA reductase CG5065 n=1 Tax=Maniola jurtina TaxID=191418 RepID=UPI001E68B7A8|nr:putative fatty acyl-CoA reductase CG5065 [Maniola jurtina]XP_045768141.1 putative fatty acyl-CoA reductase CG5065 [Maniola jurtina]
MCEYQAIADCYEGQRVFMTGGTGFLGKVLLEKLLYSCPGIEKMYLLVREKQGATPQQRLQKILEQPLFSRLKEEKPQALDKIVPIVGDISEPQLGLKADDEELLVEKVSIVYHVAATVKFNEPFEQAMNVNVAGTGRVLNLSKRMKNIKAFLYVSTAYSNTDRKVIEEIIYPAPASLNEVKKLLEIGINDNQVKELINGKPNTYAFTKALAENLVADNHGHIPAVIIRPSIVTSSKKEPMPGWIDNWFGASALITTIMKGLNRVLLAERDNCLDLIPVDYVSNLIIVAAARCKCAKEVDVYNSSTSGENPLTLGRFADTTLAYSYTHKFYDVPLPMVFYTRFKWVVMMITLLLQTLPAYIADIVLLIRGKKARYVKMQSKILRIRDTLEYFTSNTWSISAVKTRELSKSLSPSDRHLFPCDPAEIDWETYIPTYCQGIRQFLCKSKEQIS